MTQPTHPLVTSLDVLDSLDSDEMVDGHLSAERGDPEPGTNHSLAYCHGWRTRMYDFGEIPIPAEHKALVSALVRRPRLTSAQEPVLALDDSPTVRR